MVLPRLESSERLPRISGSKTVNRDPSSTSAVQVESTVQRKRLAVTFPLHGSFILISWYSGQANYAWAKAGLVGLTKTICKVSAAIPRVGPG